MPLSPLDKPGDKYGPSVHVTAIDTPPATSYGGAPFDIYPTHSSEKKFVEDGTLTWFGEVWHTLKEHLVIKYICYIVPVGAFLAIPIILYASVEPYSKRTIDGHIHSLGLWIWIEVLWTTLWLSKLIAHLIPYLYQRAASIFSTGIRKYALVLQALWVQLSFFLWMIFAISTFSVIYSTHEADKAYHAKNNGKIGWLSDLHNAIKATLCSASVWLAFKFVVQMISVGYRQKQYAEKFKENKRMIGCIDRMYYQSIRKFQEGSPSFRHLDLQIHDVTGAKKVDPDTFSTEMSLFGDKVSTALGSVVADFVGKQHFQPTAANRRVEAAFDSDIATKALARRIFRSFVKPNATACYEQDVIDMMGPGRERDASYMFKMLDRDCNGDIDEDEMILLLCEVAKQKKDMWRGALDIKDAIKVLDKVLTFFALVAAIFLFLVFYRGAGTGTWASSWSAITAFGFLFNSTAAEFFGCCFTIFVKHPYDIGDRVFISGMDMEVTKISLMYTVFKRIDNKRTVQMANAQINAITIENTSRSKEMKEQYSLNVSAGTSFSDLELLRVELTNFVNENSRDYISESVDIQLMGVGDLAKLELQVEVMHKSNWQVESVRARRRSQFMCALLSAMRKVPINGPGGGGAGAGSISNPNYSVSITNEQALAEKAKFAADQDAKKMVSKSAAAEMAQAGVAPTAYSSGLEILPSLLKGKRFSAEVDGGYYNRF